jgi:microcystin degradation protein MlrC
MRTRRLAVLGLAHETNTFSSIRADAAAYADGGVHRGKDLVDQYLDSQATYAGFLAPADEADGTDTDGPYDLVPLLAAWVNPCGPITRDAFESLLGEMVDLLGKQGPFDGVLLGLHGAAVADGYEDADVQIAAAVRARVGRDVPIGTVVDMHANLSDGVVDAVDVLLPYQTNPHVDARARGLECRTRVLDILRTGRRPALALERIPLVVTITRQDTNEEPMAGLLRQAREIEARPGMLDASVVEGFPYADVPDMGMSVVTCHADSRAAARLAAIELAAACWQRRYDLQGGGSSPAEAVARVVHHTGTRPLLLLDVGDNVGGGGPGDSTVLLAEALAQRAIGLVVVLLDADCVARLASAPVGARVDARAGGRSREQDGVPVHLVGTVVGHSDGRYEEPAMAHGGLRYFDAGPMVAVRTDEDVTVVLTSKLVQPITPAQLTAVGLDPLSFRGIVAKGVNGPRAGYAGVCGEHVVVDTPGVTRLSVEEFTYRRRRRPMFPYEQDAFYAGVQPYLPRLKLP